MQIEERIVGDVTILDLKGKMTLGEGDELLKDKINSLIHQGQKKLLPASARSCARTRRSAGRAAA
jgi:anti-sigma B factor antagonist